jgi:hypothetical protein
MHVIDTISADFQQFGIFVKYLAVDEINFKYYGHVGLRQFVCGKPEIFDCKLWTLRGTN